MAAKPILDTLPVSAEELVRKLNLMYPERSPTPDLSERELWMRAGERRLVRALNVIVQRDEQRKEKK